MSDGNYNVYNNSVNVKCVEYDLKKNVILLLPKK